MADGNVDWQELERLFDEAISVPLDQRSQLLKEVQQESSELYRELSSLLASHERLSQLDSDDSISSGVASELAVLVERVQQETLETADQPVAFDLIQQQLETIQPDFRVDGIISRGASGAVFRVHQQSLQRDVAVKALIFDDPVARKRFVRESQATAKVRHPNIVDIYSVESSDQLTYLVMELIEGPTLADLIKQDGPLNPTEAASISIQIAAGLQAAHDAGLIHRDVKPANIMVVGASDNGPPEQGKVKLIDFGIVRDLSLEQMTADRMVVGTPAYMSPEQFFTPETVDHRSDVYGLGIALYEMLTGTRPFRGVPHMIMRQVESRDALPPTQLDDRIPRDLESICMQAIHPEIQRRYQTAADLKQDLERFQSGVPTLARPVSTVERAIRWARRNRRLAAVLGVAGLLAFCLVVGSMVFALIVNSKNRQILQQKSITAESRLAAALDAQPGALPMAIELLDAEQPGTSLRLAEAMEAPDNSLPRRVNAAIARAALGDPQSEFLVDVLDDLYVSADVCKNLVTAFQDDPQAIARLWDSLASAPTPEAKAKRIILLAGLGSLEAWQQAAANFEDPTLAFQIVHSYQDWHADPVGLAKRILAADDPNSDQLLFRAIAELEPRSVNQSLGEGLAAVLSQWRPIRHYGTYHDWHRAFSNLEQSVGHRLNRPWRPNEHPQLINLDGGFRLVRMEPTVAWVGKFDQAKTNVDVQPHQVTLTRPYWIADAEVTVDQFRPFVVEELGFDTFQQWQDSSGFSRLLSPSGKHPVQAVSWFEAVRFCNWLSRKHNREPAYRKLEQTVELPVGPNQTQSYHQYELIEGANGFRLATDAQWEIANRCGSKTQYFFGSDASLLPLYGVWSANRIIEGVTVRDLRPNRNGLYGMLGNVWEWTYDRYVILDDSPRIDPTGPETYGERIGHVFQGGGINTSSGAIDAESRGFAVPNAQYGNLGFRIAIEGER